MIGTKFAHYEITNHLGTGGMGEVYQAVDSKLGRRVAIKILPEAFSRDRDRIARFEREARLLASLNHPNIAGIYGLEDSGEIRFLVLELIEGDTLAERLRLGSIPPEESLKLALQIAHAIEAAHEKGVIHRDIKPANIKITPERTIKVLDFGLAKAFSTDDRGMNLSNSPTISMAATQQGIILGTAGYMSPEQAGGEVADKRADIWSFGVVLFEMLTGGALFSGKTVSHVLADVLRADPDWKRLPVNLHPRIRMLLERCLEKDLRDRYHDIADARVDLEHVLADPGGVFIQPAPGVAPIKQAGNRVLFWGCIAASALVAGALGWFLRPAPIANPAPVVRFPFMLPEPNRFPTQPASLLAISPDGTKIAYAANSQLYLRNLNETEARPIPGTSEGGSVGPGTPVFSPDGKSLGYIDVVSLSGPFFIKRVPVSGGTPVKLNEARPGLRNFQYGLSWPTLDTMVFANADGIVRITANGGSPEILVKRVAGESFESPQMLPGGKQILFTRLAEEPGGTGGSRWDAAEIVIQSAGGNDRTVVWKGASHARYLPTGHLIYALGNTVFAIGLDLPSRKVSGSPIPILEGVQRSSNGFSDAAQYAVSDSGVIISMPATLSNNPEKGILGLVDRNGVATPFAVRPAQYRGPRLSPDDKQLAVEINGDDGKSSIWIYDMSGKSEIRRLTEAGTISTRPIWTRDSKRITFGSQRDGGWGIYEIPADGSALAKRLLAAKDKVKVYPESWSPDGKTLTFAQVTSDTDWDIWTLSAADAVTSLVAGGSGSQFGSFFSPDGRWIVYTDNVEPFGLRAQPFPTTGVVRQLTQDGEAWPVWLTGGQIFSRFRRDAGGSPQLREVHVNAGTEITSSNPRTVQLPDALLYQNYRDFDVTRSSQAFVALLPEQKLSKSNAPAAPAFRIDVILNWFEELKQRLPSKLR